MQGAGNRAPNKSSLNSSNQKLRLRKHWLTSLECVKTRFSASSVTVVWNVLKCCTKLHNKTICSITKVTKNPRALIVSVCGWCGVIHFLLSFWLYRDWCTNVHSAQISDQHQTQHDKPFLISHYPKLSRVQWWSLEITITFIFSLTVSDNRNFKDSLRVL